MKTLRNALNGYDNNTRINLNIGRNGWYEQNRSATVKDLFDNNSVYLDCRVNIVDLTTQVPEFFLEYK